MECSWHYFIKCFYIVEKTRWRRSGDLWSDWSATVQRPDQSASKGISLMSAMRRYANINTNTLLVHDCPEDGTNQSLGMFWKFYTDEAVVNILSVVCTFVCTYPDFNQKVFENFFLLKQSTGGHTKCRLCINWSSVVFRLPWLLPTQCWNSET